MTFHRDICIRVVFILFASPECRSNSDKLVKNDMQSDWSELQVASFCSSGLCLHKYYLCLGLILDSIEME